MGEELVTEVPDKGKDRPAGRIVEAGGGLPTWPSTPSVQGSEPRSRHIWSARPTLCGAGGWGGGDIPPSHCPVGRGGAPVQNWGAVSGKKGVHPLPCRFTLSMVGSGGGGCPRMGPEKVSLLVSSPCKRWPIPLNPGHRVRGCVCVGGGSQAAQGGGIAPDFIHLMLSLPLPRRVAAWQEASDLGGQWVASRESLFPSALHSPSMWQQGQARADRRLQWRGGREVPGRPLRAGDAVDQTAASGRLDLRGEWSLSPETKQTDASGVEAGSFQQGPVEKSAGGPGAFRPGKAAREAT